MSLPDKLSLIVCTLKRPREIRRLLDSFATLTRSPDETLIVDASPDQLTRAVVEELARAGSVRALRYFLVPPEHRGLTRQRNYGLERATGDIVAFLDDDTVPEPAYFDELLACFDRHPEAVGVGGAIVNEIQWRKAGSGPVPLAVFRLGQWERRDDWRWRLRKLCHLESHLPPGYMPAFGHGRPSAFPPDGQDHKVEFIMGGASGWRRPLLGATPFSAFFEGYGLYEDFDFCIRAGKRGAIYVCSKAQLAHYHAAGGRPYQFRYGLMVIRNGWFVWRRRWPRPKLTDRSKWWAITLLLTLCRAAQSITGPDRLAALSESAGRCCGMFLLLIAPPRKQLDLT